MTTTDRKRSRHRVAVVAYDGVVPFDLSTPCEIFERSSTADGLPAYEVRVCGVTREVRSSHFKMTTGFGLKELTRADTIVLPGVDDLSRPVSPALIKAVRAAAARGARIVSICTGAFVLAATGLLDGRKATTHWAGTAELARRFPLVNVDPAVLYVDEGSLLTSAGAAAGLDLCLHLVRKDLGAAAAAQTSRLSVMPLERAGGQAQFIVPQPPVTDATSLEPLLAWAQAHLSHALDSPSLARRAAMSVRTLHRHFVEQTGTTPGHWVTHARVRRSQVLLEKSRRSVEQIADEVGFGSATAFRVQFKRVVGTSPARYRASFRR